MFWREYEAKIRRFAVSVPEANAIAFAAACLERQSSVYEEFCKRGNLPNLDPIRRCLDAVWHWLLRGDLVNTSDLIQLLGEVPSPREGSNDASYFILRVLAGAEMLLKLPGSYNGKWADYIPGNAFGVLQAALFHAGIEATSEIKETPDFFDHPMKKIELDRQFADMSEMCQLHIGRPQFEILRQRSLNVGFLGSLWLDES